MSLYFRVLKLHDRKDKHNHVESQGSENNLEINKAETEDLVTTRIN